MRTHFACLCLEHRAKRELCSRPWDRDVLKWLVQHLDCPQILGMNCPELLQTATPLLSLSPVKNEITCALKHPASLRAASLVGPHSNISVTGTSKWTFSDHMTLTYDIHIQTWPRYSSTWLSCPNSGPYVCPFTQQRPTHRQTHTWCQNYYTVRWCEV